ncbi:hypothetical protein [Williamsia deligens]|uniref:Holin n=1 Tax=Williamsia deligens TaxID=321325 RepID=A0ABW3GEF1_9NOCA|nr:hypothetical protein [Williamsia deligens]MCP2196320.1 hypothetical protein [Williamsia deligens]
MTVRVPFAAQARASLTRLWRLEPVRTALAPLIATAVVAGLAKAGVDGSLAGIIATVVLGALGLTAQEIARANVTPQAKVPDLVRGAARDTLTEVVNDAASQLRTVDPTVSQALDSVITTVERRVGKHRA